MYDVFTVERFEKKSKKLFGRPELLELDKFITGLKGGSIKGKPLSYDFFREKRIGGKRVYFLVYSDISTILIVRASDKKSQQATIDEIKFLLPEFKKRAYELHAKVS